MSFQNSDCGWHKDVTWSFIDWKACSSWVPCHQQLQPLEGDAMYSMEKVWKHSSFLVEAKAIVLCGVLGCLSMFVKEFYGSLIAVRV